MMAYVTDHAVLMYLKRIEGVDVEAIRRKLTVVAIDTAAAFGCKTIKMGAGFKLRLRGDVVTTITVPKRRPHPSPSLIVVPEDAIDESPVADAGAYLTAPIVEDAYVPEGA
jgi:hypothetical protein